MNDACVKCGVTGVTLIATKETPNKASRFMCEEHWFHQMKQKQKVLAGKKKMAGTE